MIYLSIVLPSQMIFASRVKKSGICCCCYSNYRIDLSKQQIGNKIERVDKASK